MRLVRAALYSRTAALLALAAPYRADGTSVIAIAKSPATAPSATCHPARFRPTACAQDFMPPGRRRFERFAQSIEAMPPGPASRN